MPNIEKYLDQLDKDKEILVTNLNEKGVLANREETFTSLVPKVLDAQGKYQEKVSKAKESGPVEVLPDASYDALSKVTIPQITSSDITNLEPQNIKRGETILGVTGTYGATSQVKSATPSTSSQVITPDEGIEFLSAVNISAVTKSIDSNITPGNIRNGVEILDVVGTFSGDLIPQENKDITPTKSQQIIKADDGFDVMAQVTVSPVTSSIDSNIQNTNIKKGVTILGVTGIYEPEPTQEKTVVPTTNIQSIIPDEGFGGLSKVTVNAVTSSIDQDIKPENIKDGIQILGVTGTLPEFIPETITVSPSIEQQIIRPSSGKTGITEVTVNPVTNSIDESIIPENIRANKTILGVTGTYAGDGVTFQEKTVVPNTSEQIITPDESYTALSKVTVSPVETEEITIEPSLSQQVINRDGQLPLGKVTVKNVTSTIDPNIQPENIKRNMSILGVVGTYIGEQQNYFGPLTKGDSYTSGITKSILKVPDDLVISGTDASYLFKGCSNLTELPSLDYSTITKGSYMFSSCGIKDYSKLNMPALTNANNMFSNTNLDSINLTLPNLSTLDQMFFQATLNGDIVLHVPSARSMNAMFNGAKTSTKDINITFYLKEQISSMRTAFSLSYYGNYKVKKVTLDSEDGEVHILSKGPEPILNIEEFYVNDNIRFDNIDNCFGSNSYQGADPNLKVYLNISEVTSMNYAFRTYWRSGWNRVRTLVFSGSGDKITSIKGAFTPYSNYGDTDDFSINGIPNLGKAFTAQQSNYENYTLDLSKRNVDYESLIGIINGLYDLNLTYNVAGGGTLYTQQLLLGETNLAKLTPEEILVATNKGWTVS